jgi:preprotein translocase subunit SecD
LDKDSEIIAERMRQALGRDSRVTVYDDCMEIEPGAYADRDLTMRLVTGRGQAQIFASAEAPDEEAPAPQDAPVILSQDGIAAASVLSPNDPEEVRLKLELTEDGSAQVADFLKNDPGKGLYLALDEQVVIAQPLDVTEAGVLELRGLALEEASSLAAMLDNEPLSVGYEIEE